jgi:ABC-type multidrug transport system fused ATPase/permease subunit
MADVYYVLAFAGLTYGPSKSLLSNITGIADAYSSLGKLENLFNSQETEELITTDEDLENGSILIENLVASYNPHPIYEHHQQPA